MMSSRFGRGVLAAALASATLLSAGCATETTYRPATGQGFSRTGFSEQQVEPSRFIVRFAGNTVTPRETVERYLLFRSAELTLQQGGDYFITVDRDTDHQTRTYTTPGIGGYGSGFGYGSGLGYGSRFGYGFGGGYFGPSWNFYGRFGHRFYDPYFGDPFFFNNFDIQTVDRYEAEAQIVIGHGPVPQGNPRAFDAHAVTQTLGPSIVLPGQERARRY